MRASGTPGPGPRSRTRGFKRSCDSTSHRHRLAHHSREPRRAGSCSSILLLFSAVSWGIVVYKKLQFRRAARQTARSSTCSARAAASRKCRRCAPVCGAVRSSGCFRPATRSSTRSCAAPARAKPGAPAARPTLRSLEAVDRALLRASTTEVAKLEHRVPFLATTASITPYIGLFGTVLGIIRAFAGHRGSRLDEPGRRRARHRRGADRDGVRASSRRFRPCTSTTT